MRAGVADGPSREAFHPGPRVLCTIRPWLELPAEPQCDQGQFRVTAQSPREPWFRMNPALRQLVCMRPRLLVQALEVPTPSSPAPPQALGLPAEGPCLCGAARPRVSGPCRASGGRTESGRSPKDGPAGQMQVGPRAARGSADLGFSEQCSLGVQLPSPPASPAGAQE